MITKQLISHALRRTGLFEIADSIRGYAYSLKTQNLRRQFGRENPHFALPPPSLAYDAYSRWTPEGYRQGGRAQAEYLAALIRRHHPTARSVAEWGCGPMRLLRHMPGLLPGAAIIGLDYNPHTIAWAKKQPEFRNIRLHRNDLRPPLPLRDGEADAIYNLSVFTHLSEDLHHAYIRDLRRCVAPGGILISTTSGDWYRKKMTSAELERYERGQIVVRNGVTEGKRGYTAIHPPAFVRQLLDGWRIVEHITLPDVPGLYQDVWVARKPA